MKIIMFISLLFIFFGCSTGLNTYLEKGNYSKLTSYDELIDFINEAENMSDLIDKEFLAVSSEGRKIPVLKVSSTKFHSNNKLKVMIFAQQHGDEQSGKEGVLLLIKEIANGSLDYLFDRLEILLIPQVNPDGSEKNKRRNSNGVDLNRNHLILSENETAGLHTLFHKYLPEATLDVHEYSPYSKSWVEFGYLKNYDEQIGTLTNPNVSKNIIRVQKERLLDYIQSYLAKKGISSNEYLLGGPPGINRMRYSTIDVNDGRQGFGILNSFSNIQEGKNGRDSLDNIEHRAIGQCEGMKAYLQFLYENADGIKLLVKTERDMLLNSIYEEEIVIRMEHVNGESPVLVNLRSIKTGNDTIFTVKDFNSKIESHIKVKKPNGYLIPKNDIELKSFIDKHHVQYSDFIKKNGKKVIRYNILEVNKKTEEEDEHLDPKVQEQETENIIYENYLYLSTNQLTSNLLVIALEPQSMLGIMQYKKYQYLLDNKIYPILKVVDR